MLDHVSFKTLKYHVLLSIFKVLNITWPNMSTMGSAFLGAVQHDDLRNFVFLISNLTLFASTPASMLNFNETPYWENAPPRPRPPSMLG